MGRRSRTRVAQESEPSPRERQGRERAFDRLSPVRRVLARYLIFALLIAVGTVGGIAGLGGTTGPLIVLASITLAAGAAYRWAQRRLTGELMTDDDRMMRTMAAGMLVLS